MEMNEIILFIIIILQFIFHHFERKDLYNRIMSRDLTEYKNKDIPKQPYKSAHRRVIENWRRTDKGGDE